MWEDETRSHSEALTQTGQKTPQPLPGLLPARAEPGSGSVPSGVPLGGSGAQC